MGSADMEVPHRWMHCPRKAMGLLANKFLAFKTLLSDKYNGVVPEANRFTPNILFKAIKNYRIKLGLIVDLTNTSRFYDKSEIEANECKYMKINCRGHGETPTLEQTEMFIKIVSTFIKNNPLFAIGVHCTHGFNRTGFLLVSYLVQEMDCSVEAALREFARLRPPGIYKQDYIVELYRRYNIEEIDDVPLAPELPTWHTESDDGDGDSRGEGSKSKRRREINKVATFLPDVSGVLQYTTQPKLSELQKTIQKMCGWRNSGFPGSQPVSMNNKNLEKLAEHPYRVSWKADGTRYLMLIYKENEVYLFDRDNCAFLVKTIRFPCKNEPETHLENTLLDGEMVIDIFEGRKIPRFLVYDIIKINGMDVGKADFYPNRLRCIEDEIVAPRHHAMAQGRIFREREPFSIRLKQFWDISQAGSLLGEKFAKTLCHEPDGLVFQPSKGPYVAGRCDDVLKWKPSNLNSIDFKLKITINTGQGLLPTKEGHLYVGQLDYPFGKMKYTSAIKDLDNKIIECKFENNQWVFMRERTDKSFPNSYETAAAVFETIANPVTQERLLGFIKHKRYYDDCDRMPPPPKKARH